MDSRKSNEEFTFALPARLKTFAERAFRHFQHYTC